MKSGVQKTVPVILLAVLFTVAAASASGAGSSYPGYTRLKGEVTSVDKGSLQVSSKKVVFMNLSEGGETYQTKIYDIDGNPIKPVDIKKGDVVLIRGQKMPNGDIVANYIHLQQHE